MSSIMRGDQTVSLIQQYHAHYPEIARNTQDVEGRKQRVYMWAKITEELNAQYNTSFTVEQFKKKVQNVQCTSRQKIQSGKRNLGDAEMEYMRLFEQERLGNIEVSNKLGSFTGFDDRVSAPFLGGEDFNANSVGRKVKFIDAHMDVKPDVLNGTKETDDSHEDDEDRSTPSTSDAAGGFGTISNGGNGGNVLNAIFGKTPAINNNNSLDQAQQLLLAMMTNNFSTLNNGIGNNAEMSEAGDNNKSLTETLLATIKGHSTCRKRNSLLTDNNNIVINSTCDNNNINCNNNNNNNNNSSGALNKDFANNENINQLPAKRRRKQPHALHLSHLRPVETLLSLDPSASDCSSTAQVSDMSLFCTGLAAAKGPVEGPRSSSTPANSSALTSQADHRWRNDVVEMQKAILENQRRIIGIMEKQTTMCQVHELRTPDRSSHSCSPSNASQQMNSAESAGGTQTNSRSDSLLSSLCDKIDALSKALSSIDSTLKLQMSSTKATDAENNLLDRAHQIDLKPARFHEANFSLIHQTGKNSLMLKSKESMF